MSIVTEVLTSAGLVEKKEVNGKVKALTDHIKELQNEIYTATVERYVDFYPCFNSVSNLADQVDLIKSEIDSVSNKIESEIKGQLNVSTSEFQSLSRELIEVNGILSILETLVQLHDYLEEVAESTKAKKFGHAADALSKINELVSKPLPYQDSDIKIFDALITEFKVQKEKLIFDLNDVWKEHIAWRSPENVASTGDLIELKVVIGGEEMHVIEHMIDALEKINHLDSKIKVFGERFLTRLVKSLLSNENVTIKENTNRNEKVITLNLKTDIHTAPLFVTFFRKFEELITFLNESFLKLSITRNGNRVTLLELLGAEVANSAVDMIIKECLSLAIPSTVEHLEGFRKVINATENFQKFLMDIKFLPESNTALLAYVQNVNVLYANKKCQQISGHARKLMTSNVHNTVDISKDVTLQPLPQLQKGDSTTTQTVELTTEEKLSPDSFKMPDCKISESINAVMNLAYEILNEAVASKPQCAIQMFYAVRNIFELYCSVFPTYHRQSLETLPQLTALHHNNCMFISHHLMTLGHQFSAKLPKSINATFVDLIPKIRGMGTESFMKQMTNQRDQLLEFLQAADGFMEMSNQEKYCNGERAVKQCLHQLTHLQNVWHDVLPANVYRKAIGMLVNTVAVEVIDNITSLEDISSVDAKQLYKLMSLLIDKAESFFKLESDDSNPLIELQRNVAKWPKFKELHLVLNASLQGISDRWADGKGPLAEVFSANELKQLIRALFQNTDRRASVLSRIK
ncbi:hypothetical protein SNE40_009894 [Patella caerulea]|uniref:Centromere/kinetochore protein zw10 homolog n=1 Tax=Patella caerulea TaxID=87958 RepID=A0AAN8JQJ9_PATCE